MNLHEHYLSTYMAQASEEQRCIKDCLILVEGYVEEGNIDKAQLHTYNMLRSLQQLEILKDRKLEVEKHLINGMPTVTNIEIRRVTRSE